MAVLVTIEAVVIVLLAVLVAGLLRSHADILRALHELGVSESPDTQLLTIQDRMGDDAGRSPGSRIVARRSAFPGYPSGMS